MTTPSQSEKNGKPRLITVTLRMDDKHDVRAVRRLLKALKRGYGLECVGLEERVKNENEQATKS